MFDSPLLLYNISRGVLLVLLETAQQIREITLDSQRKKIIYKPTT